MNPLRNVEEIETLGVVLLGVLLLIVLEPVSRLQLLFAGILALLLVVFAAIDFWQWRHDGA